MSPPTIDCVRLRRRRQFTHIRDAGRKYVAPGLVMQACAHGRGGNEIGLGFTVSRKVGSAVVRNRVRRRLKAAAGKILPLHGSPGFDYVIIGRKAAIDRDFKALVKDVESALKGLGIYRSQSRKTVESE